jgi:RNAse (barnase) inhibitor barstar
MQNYIYSPEIAILRKGPISLYHQTEFLDQDINWFIENGYKVYQADCREWSSLEKFHESVSELLDFPSYYGSNLDGFEDCLCELDLNVKRGGLIVLLNFEFFAYKFPNKSTIIVDILANVSRLYLIDNIKLITLIQTNDKNLSFPPIGCMNVGVNQKES